jgi:hypothetical protein
VNVPYTLVINTTVDATNTTLNNTVEVTSDTYDPNPDNNNDTAKTTVLPEADLTVNKTVDLSSAHKGDVVTWTVTVKNNGPDKANEIAEMLTEIFEHYLQFCGGDQDKLFSSMTKTEEKALEYLLNTIGDEGVISVTEAIRDSGISRPVFTSLFDKLNRYKGAEIRNMGVKGTYINFYDHVMSMFEQE